MVHSTRYYGDGAQYQMLPGIKFIKEKYIHLDGDYEMHIIVNETYQIMLSCSYMSIVPHQLGRRKSMGLTTKLEF